MEFTLRHPYPLEAFLAWRPAIEAKDEVDIGGYSPIRRSARA
jgi:hypothetical protein